MKNTIIGTLLLMLVLLPAFGCSSKLAARSELILDDTAMIGTQLLVVLTETDNTSLANVYTLEKDLNGWKHRCGPLPAMIGRNGFAPPGEKREGDGKVPTGMFPLESAFGYAASINSRMSYRQTTEDDLWVDDVNAPDYNKWVKRGQSRATSFEALKIADQRYQLGIITGYNRNPAISGLGSAIFVHTWLEEGFTTSGCVALDGEQLRQILKWLEPAKKPMILMGTRTALAPIPLLASLPLSTIRPGILEKQIRSLVDGQGERLVEYRTPDGFFGMAVALPGKALSHIVLTRWATDGKPEIGELMVPKEQALQTVKEAARQFNLQRHRTQRNSISNRQPHTD